MVSKDDSDRTLYVQQAVSDSSFSRLRLDIDDFLGLGSKLLKDKVAVFEHCVLLHQDPLAEVLRHS